MQTTDRSNQAKAVSNLRRKPELKFRGPQRVFAANSVPFSRVCTAERRDRQTDLLTDARSAESSIAFVRISCRLFDAAQQW